MRLVYLIVGISIFIIFTIDYWFEVSKINVFSYRAIRVGYQKLMDSLFNEFQRQEYDDIEDMFEPLIQTGDYNEDANTQKLTCYTWSSLNDLIHKNNNRVTDASKKVRDSPVIIYDRLQKDLQITNAIVNSYNERLKLAINKLPSFMSSHQNQLSEMLATVNDMNQGFQYFIGDAIEKIDHDHYVSHKSYNVRLSKILQQFELLIKSQNEAHLDCACDAAKHLDVVVEDLMDRFHLCVNITGEQFSNYIKETITPLANSMETTIRSINRGIKKSKTSVEVFYQLPIKVCNAF